MGVELAVGLIGGGLALVGGGELLVRGAVTLAAAAGVSAVLVGLTVVAFGTSAPELAVSALAASGGQPDIALGNVVGSNLFNVLVILGISALVLPLSVHARILKQELRWMVGSALAAGVVAATGGVGQGVGVAFLLALTGYLALQVRSARQERDPELLAEVAAEVGAPKGALRRWVLPGLFVLGGLGLLVLGADLFVDASAELALTLGVDERVVGLTVVAVGTSLPELVTSVVAAVRGERDIAVGNVVGSNVFNVLCVLGASAVVAVGGVPVSPGLAALDLPMMMMATLLCVPVFASGGHIDRREGVLMLSLYGVYLACLLGQAVGWQLADELRFALLVGLAPVAVLVTTAVALRERRLMVA